MAKSKKDSKLGKRINSYFPSSARPMVLVALLGIPVAALVAAYSAFNFPDQPVLLLLGTIAPILIVIYLITNLLSNNIRSLVIYENGLVVQALNRSRTYYWDDISSITLDDRDIRLFEETGERFPYRLIRFQFGDQPPLIIPRPLMENRSAWLARDVKLLAAPFLDRLDKPKPLI